MHKYAYAHEYICMDIITYGILFIYFLNMLSTIYAPSQPVKAIILTSFNNLGPWKPLFSASLLQILCLGGKILTPDD